MLRVLPHDGKMVWRTRTSSDMEIYTAMQLDFYVDFTVDTHRDAARTVSNALRGAQHRQRPPIRHGTTGAGTPAHIAICDAAMRTEVAMQQDDCQPICAPRRPQSLEW